MLHPLKSTPVTAARMPCNGALSGHTRSPAIERHSPASGSRPTSSRAVSSARVAKPAPEQNILPPSSRRRSPRRIIRSRSSGGSVTQSAKSSPAWTSAMARARWTGVPKRAIRCRALIWASTNLPTERFPRPSCARTCAKRSARALAALGASFGKGTARICLPQRRQFGFGERSLRVALGRELLHPRNQVRYPSGFVRQRPSCDNVHGVSPLRSHTRSGAPTCSSKRSA